MRTKARTSLRIALSQRLPWTERLELAARALERHHSRSVLPARCRARLGVAAAFIPKWSPSSSTMTTWKCSVCRQMCRATAFYCQSCGGHWQQVAEERQQGPANYTAAVEQPPWQRGWWSNQPSSSPRRRTDAAWRPQSPRRRGKEPKGKGKKGAGKDSAPQQGAVPGPPPEAPTISGLPAPPGAKLPSKPPPATTTAATSSMPAEERKLLADVLANIPADQLPPDLQRRLGQFQVEATHQQGKHMHRLVSDKVQLRKELEQLRSDRAAYNTAWEAYVLKLLEMWKSQGEARLAAMAAYAEKETELSVRLANATQALATAAAAEPEPVSGPHIIDDDMDECDAADAMVTTAVEVEAEVRERNRRSQEQLQAHNTRIQGLLKQAHQEAAEAVEEAQKQREGSRTPRRGQGGGDAKAKDGKGAGSGKSGPSQDEPTEAKKPPG